MDREKILEEMKAGNPSNIPMVETDFWRFLSEEYPEGSFYRVNALEGYIQSKHGNSIFGFFKGEEEILNILRAIADHYGWVKAREEKRDV